MLEGEERLLIADFTHLEYTWEDLLSLTTGTRQGYRFKVLVATGGKAICHLAYISMLEFKEDFLKSLLFRASSGRALTQA